jgi:hypothetical protein
VVFVYKYEVNTYSRMLHGDVRLVRTLTNIAFPSSAESWSYDANEKGEIWLDSTLVKKIIGIRRISN